MIVGFSKHGAGRGAKPIGYLTAESVTVARAPLHYLTGEKGRTGLRRDPLPVVLRGDPEKTRRLIDSLDFKWKYTSGVLSFAPGEKISPDVERQIMTEFEQTAFAGIKTGNYDLLIVRHTHAGHHELHFVSPRVELSTGKSLNIAPPGKASRELFDSFRSKINLQFTLASPEDPGRARGLRPPSALARLKAHEIRAGTPSKPDVREAITANLQDQVRRGRIKTQDDTLAVLREQGFVIRRAGKDYITVEEPTLGQRVRLRGNLYSERPSLGTESEAVSTRTLATLKEKLARLTAARAQYNEKRYRTEALPKDADRILRDLRAVGREGRTPETEHDRARESSFACFEGFGARLHRARGGTERHCLALNHAARQLFGADNRLERGIGATRDAREQLDRAIEGASDRLACLRDRAANKQILQKYGVLAPAAGRRAKERDQGLGLEMEMERCR